MKEPQKVGEIKPKSTVETACVEATAVQGILPFGKHKTFAFQARHSMHCDIPLSRCQHSAPLHPPAPTPPRRSLCPLHPPSPRPPSHPPTPSLSRQGLPKGRPLFPLHPPAISPAIAPARSLDAPRRVFSHGLGRQDRLCSPSALW